MRSEDLAKAAEVLAWLSARFAELPEDREKALEASLICSTANMIVAEYQLNALKGVEPYEALRRAACGEMDLPTEKTTVLRILSARPKE